MAYKTVHHIIVILFILGLQLQAPAQQPFDAEKALSELASEKGNMGVTAAYSIDGQTKWSDADGLACADGNIPFKTTTLTRIASICKSMTAVAIMQLVEQDLIDLDVPIQNYLNEFPEKEKGDITTRQLLSHTSGLSQYQGEKEVESKVHYATLQEAMSVFIDRPLLFEPGSDYSYTTYGYVVLGRIIEVVSGLSYGDYMQKHIFDIAGMEDTGIEETGESYDNKSCLYHNKKKKAKASEQNDLSNRVPGGGFYSTVGDVLKFGNAILEGKLISESTFEEMLNSQPVEYDGNKYGLGWYFYGPAPRENIVIGHSGGQTGCSSQLMIIPQSKTVVVVLSNTSGTYPDIANFASNLIALSEATSE